MNYCKHGHEMTEANTMISRGARVRKRCRACNYASRPLVKEHKQIKERQYRMEDIAELLELGATFDEIVERGPYAHWESMNGAFNKYGRHDLQEKMRKLRDRDIADHKFSGDRFFDGHMSTFAGIEG